jgi:PleD family two-component response regulator
VVVVADSGSDEKVAAALEAGAYDVLPRTKIDGPEVYRAVRNALEASRMSRALESAGLDADEDAVTRLPSRRRFLEKLEDALAVKGEGRTVGVLLIGIDGFKGINSGFGYEVGNELLRIVAGRLPLRAPRTPSPAGRLTSSRLADTMSRPDAPFVAQPSRAIPAVVREARTSTSRRASASRFTPRTGTTFPASSSTPTPRCIG